MGHTGHAAAAAAGAPAAVAAATVVSPQEAAAPTAMQQANTGPPIVAGGKYGGRKRKASAGVAVAAEAGSTSDGSDLEDTLVAAVVERPAVKKPRGLPMAAADTDVEMLDSLLDSSTPLEHVSPRSAQQCSQQQKAAADIAAAAAEARSPGKP